MIQPPEYERTLSQNGRGRKAGDRTKNEEDEDVDIPFAQQPQDDVV
jgi:hypothetical protein